MIGAEWLGVVACFAVIGWIVAIAQSLSRRDDRRYLDLYDRVWVIDTDGRREFVITHVVRHQDLDHGTTLQIYAEPWHTFQIKRMEL